MVTFTALYDACVLYSAPLRDYIVPAEKRVRLCERTNDTCVIDNEDRFYPVRECELSALSGTAHDLHSAHHLQIRGPSNWRRSAYMVRFFLNP